MFTRLPQSLCLQGLFVRLICHSGLAPLSYDMGMAVEPDRIEKPLSCITKKILTMLPIWEHFLHICN